MVLETSEMRTTPQAHPIPPAQHGFHWRSGASAERCRFPGSGQRMRRSAETPLRVISRSLHGAIKPLWLVCRLRLAPGLSGRRQITQRATGDEQRRREEEKVWPTARTGYKTGGWEWIHFEAHPILRWRARAGALIFQGVSVLLQQSPIEDFPSPQDGRHTKGFNVLPVRRTDEHRDQPDYYGLFFRSQGASLGAGHGCLPECHSFGPSITWPANCFLCSFTSKVP